MMNKKYIQKKLSKYFLICTFILFLSSSTLAFEKEGVFGKKNFSGRYVSCSTVIANKGKPKFMYYLMGVVDGYVTATNENIHGKKDFYDGFKTSELVDKIIFHCETYPGKTTKDAFYMVSDIEVGVITLRDVQEFIVMGSLKKMEESDAKRKKKDN